MLGPMFGPYYPPPLQRVVDHAARLAELLRNGRLVHTPVDDWGTAWMTGRDGEIERFVEATLTARRRGKLDDAGATRSLAAYLASLHDGMARRLRLKRPACCSSGPATGEPTVPRSVEDLLANLASSPEPEEPRRADASGTPPACFTQRSAARSARRSQATSSPGSKEPGTR